MSKKVLILSGSPRAGGNSDILCDEFAKGAEAAGNIVEKIRVSEKILHHVRLVIIAVVTEGNVFIRMTWRKFYKK